MFIFRYDDSFLVSGLAKAPSGLTTVEWQNRVKQDVGGVVSLLLNRDCPIKVVHNQTGTRRSTTYLVKMSNIQDARDIRGKFGSFFAGGQDNRPPSLKSVSISNWSTAGTKVRIAILKVLAARYRASNPGSRVQVNSFLSISGSSPAALFLLFHLLASWSFDSLLRSKLSLMATKILGRSELSSYSYLI